jgi:hypothetical protein
MKEAALRAMLIRATAQAALAATHCTYPNLAGPALNTRLVIDDDGEVVATDEDGEIRRDHTGRPLTALELAQEMARDPATSGAWGPR